MGLLGKIILLAVTVFVVYVAVGVRNFLQIPPVPHLEDSWWGKGHPTETDETIKPFVINIPQQILDDLNNRLKNHRPFVLPLEGVQQQYGINTNLLTEIVDFWRTKYNWREREKYLNKYPQFKTKILGLDVHFIHVKPSVTKNVRVLPLLLLHGWPGSVREFYEIIPFLTQPQNNRDFVFEVVIPSLPGYGFSEAAAKPGFGTAQMSNVFNKLMQRLKHTKYYVQGGDWGAAIISNMATLYPENILGLHSNMCIAINNPLMTLRLLLGNFYPPLVVEKEFEDLLYPLSKTISFSILETGYMHIQSTKPDTVGVGLNDSPVGLAAYIIEKFTTWTNPNWKKRKDGGLLEKFTYTDLLDNVMIYWVTGSITTSMRLYSENFNKEQTSLQLDNIPIKVPTACAKFKNELLFIPDSLITYKYPYLVQSNFYQDGGHFAAFELPKVLANDVWNAVEKFEKINRSKS